jgi:hypothetical protein
MNKSGQRLVRCLFNDHVMKLGKHASTPFPHLDRLSPIKIPIPVFEEAMVAQDQSLHGWYNMDDFVAFFGRLRIDHATYQVDSKVHFLPVDKTLFEAELLGQAEQAAVQAGVDDLSATLTASSS